MNLLNKRKKKKLYNKKGKVISDNKNSCWGKKYQKTIPVFKRIVTSVVTVRNRSKLSDNNKKSTWKNLQLAWNSYKRLKKKTESSKKLRKNQITDISFKNILKHVLEANEKDLEEYK